MIKRIDCNGVALNVFDSGSGQPLLLVHGFPLDHTMWRGQMDDLSDRFRVIAPDLRGFGKSQVVPSVATMEQMADDLAALLESLGEREPVTFCGLSMGGYVAWQFWRRHRARLKHLILCDTRAVADSDEMAQFRLKTAERVLREGPSVVADMMLAKLFAESTLRAQPEILAATRQVILAADAQGVAAALLGMAQRIDMTETLSQIDVPALVVCGEHDAISTVEEMRGIAGSIPGAEFVEIKDAGHMAPLEQPRAINEAIRLFLQR